MTLSARRSTRPGIEELDPESFAWERPTSSRPSPRLYAGADREGSKRESERAVRALSAAAAQFEKLDSRLGEFIAPSLASFSADEGGSRVRILAAEARVRSALARVLPALREIAEIRTQKRF